MLQTAFLPRFCSSVYLTWLQRIRDVETESLEEMVELADRVKQERERQQDQPGVKREKDSQDFDSGDSN